MNELCFLLFIWQSYTNILNIDDVDSFQANSLSLYLHDAMYLYLITMDEVLSQGGDPRNGDLIFEASKNKTFTGNIIL